MPALPSSETEGFSPPLFSAPPGTYLDFAASHPPDPAIREKLATLPSALFGNPSSLHRFGREAKRVLEEARERCAGALGCRPENLVFVSGASEGNNLILRASEFQTRKDRTFLVSRFEHPSMEAPASDLKRRGSPVTFLTPGTDGRLQPEKCEKKLREAREKGAEVQLLSVMSVQNETGTVQPLEELGALLRRYEAEFGQNTGKQKKIWFHSDLVQAVGKIPLPPLEDSPLDSAVISGHKLGGLRGGALLYLRKPRTFPFKGGKQEHGLRPGTENLSGIVSLSLALSSSCVPAAEQQKRHEEDLNKMKQLMKILQDLPAVRLFPKERLLRPEHYSPFILSMAVPPVPGEVLARLLDEEGMAVSTGSACSASEKDRHLKAQGLRISEEEARCMIRVSWGRETSFSVLEQFTEALKRVLPKSGLF